MATIGANRGRGRSHWGRALSGVGERRVDDSLRLCEDRLQVVAAFEAFAVDLVDVLGARRTRGEPVAVGNHLDAADRRVVSRRLCQHFADRRARELCGLSRPRREFVNRVFLLSPGGRLDAVQSRPREAVAKTTYRL